MYRQSRVSPGNQSNIIIELNSAPEHVTNVVVFVSTALCMHVQVHQVLLTYNIIWILWQCGTAIVRRES